MYNSICKQVCNAAAHGAAHGEPLPEDDTTPDSVYVLLTPLEVEEEVYTRPLPLTSCQEDPPWVWTIRSCVMADLVY